MSARKLLRLAGAGLRKVADLLDPPSPVIKFEGGVVTIHGIPIARVTAGQIITDRAKGGDQQ